MDSSKHQGRCMCGDVVIEVDPQVAPAAQLICHCVDCRTHHTSPAVDLICWGQGSGGLRVVQGEDKLRRHRSSAWIERSFCQNCGTAMMNREDRFKLVETFPSLLPSMPYQPAMHIYYKERIRDVADALPKYLDLPAAFGGSDEQV